MALTGQPGDVLHPIRVLSEEVISMEPYEIMTIALRVIEVLLKLIKYRKHRK
jgi:hypothetical protein